MIVLLINRHNKNTRKPKNQASNKTSIINNALCLKKNVNYDLAKEK